VKPLSICWQRCFAERSVLSCLTGYIVVCRSVLGGLFPLYVVGLG
jgi:hypothetical protein